MNRCVVCHSPDLFDGDLRCHKCENKFDVLLQASTIIDEDPFGEGRGFGERLGALDLEMEL